jgi:hypothetical protein
MDTPREKPSLFRGSNKCYQKKRFVVKTTIMGGYVRNNVSKRNTYRLEVEQTKF